VIVELLNQAFYEHHEESYTSSASLLFAQFANAYPDMGALKTMVKSHVVDGGPSALTSQIIVSVLTHTPEAFHKLDDGEGASNPYVQGVLKKIQISLSENTLISRPAREARELVKNTEPWCHESEL